MNTSQKWQLAVAAAARIVAEAKKRNPVDAYAFDVGGGQQQTNSNFVRLSNQSLGKTYPALPSYLSELIRQQSTSAGPPESLVDTENGLLSRVMSRSPSDVPYGEVFQEASQVDPLDFLGRPELARIIQRNPFSTDWEEATNALYDSILKRGLSTVGSGPGNIRGGHARQGYALSDFATEMGNNRFQQVHNAQMQEAGVVEQAVQIANSIESARRGSKLAAQGQATAAEGQNDAQALQAASLLGPRRGSAAGFAGLGAETLGKPTQSQIEQSYGTGQQNTVNSNWGVGLNCCFIFMQSLHGVLPWYVRVGRDEYCTTNRRQGYVACARVLVPWMQRSAWATRLVDTLMVRPFLALGKLHYETPQERHGLRWWVLNIVPRAWFGIWSVLGLLQKKG